MLEPPWGFHMCPELWEGEPNVDHAPPKDFFLQPQDILKLANSLKQTVRNAAAWASYPANFWQEIVSICRTLLVFKQALFSLESTNKIIGRFSHATACEILRYSLMRLTHKYSSHQQVDRWAEHSISHRGSRAEKQRTNIQLKLPIWKSQKEFRRKAKCRILLEGSPVECFGSIFWAWLGELRARCRFPEAQRSYMSGAAAKQK